MAVAGRNRQRGSFHPLFSTVRSKLALLDRIYTAHRCDLVFGRKFEAPLAAQSVAWICRGDCLLYQHVRLARSARRFVSQLLSARAFVPVVDLSRGPFCVLGVVHRIDQTE